MNGSTSLLVRIFVPLILNLLTCYGKGDLEKPFLMPVEGRSRNSFSLT